MTTLSPTRLRRMFNVRSERLLRSIFGQHYSSYMAFYTKLYAKRYGHNANQDYLIRLENRWLRMHAKWLREAEDENAPSVHMA